MSSMPTFAFKVSVVGCPGVGKTSLIRRFVEGVFDESYIGTIGVVVSRRVVSVDAGSVNLIVWDIEGAESSDELHHHYLKGSQGLLFVADGTSRATFTTMLDLKQQLPEADCQVVLLNKVDRSGEWAISPQDVEELGWAHQVYETSALTGAAVDDAFGFMAASLSGEGLSQ